MRVLLNTHVTLSALVTTQGQIQGRVGGGGLQLLTPHYEKLEMKEMKSNCLISQYTFSKLSGGDVPGTLGTLAE